MPFSLEHPSETEASATTTWVSPDWADFDSIAGAAASLRQHPAFDAAVQASARGVIDNFQTQPLLNLVMNDRARYLFLTAALALHADPDPNGNRLLPGRLIAFCEEARICSRGRAKAMLAALRWGGYVEPGPQAGDGRARPLVPADKLAAALRGRWRRQIEIVSALQSEASAAAVAFEHDPDFIYRYALAFHERLRTGFRVVDHAPALIPFAESNAAMPILIVLYLAGRAGTTAPSLAALARQFSVSRAHVRKTLRSAAAAGMVGQDAADGAFVAEPALGESIAAFLAVGMLTFIDISICLTAEPAAA